MEIARGTFERISPAKFADKVGIPLGWVVVRHSHLPEKLARRRTHARWVCIKCGSQRVYRVLRYSVNLRSGDIVMDWAGWIDLQGRTDKESDVLELTIRTARWYEFLTIPLRHVDPGYRLAAWLGVVSLWLGVISLGVSLSQILQSSSGPSKSSAQVASKIEAHPIQPGKVVSGAQTTNKAGPGTR